MREYLDYLKNPFPGPELYPQNRSIADVVAELGRQYARAKHDAERFSARSKSAMGAEQLSALIEYALLPFVIGLPDAPHGTHVQPPYNPELRDVFDRAVFAERQKIVKLMPIEEVSIETH